MSVTIRKATLSDKDSIAELVGQLGYPSSPEEVQVRLDTIHADDDQVVYVAETEGGDIVGWVHVFGAYRLLAEPFVEIGGLIVAEGQRGSGVGKALLAAAEAWAQDHGFNSIRVRSNVIREGAPRFYERLGYHRVKQQNVFYKALN